MKTLGRVISLRDDGNRAEIVLRGDGKSVTRHVHLGMDGNYHYVPIVRRLDEKTGRFVRYPVVGVEPEVYAIKAGPSGPVVTRL